MALSSTFLPSVEELESYPLLGEFIPRKYTAVLQTVLIANADFMQFQGVLSWKR